jgi:hypothetical protein
MTQDTYRFAYEEACAELKEILAQFDQLRARKTQMEQVAEALRPLLTDAPVLEAPAAVPESAVEPAPFLVQPIVEAVPIQAAVPMPAPEPVLVPVVEKIQEPEPEPVFVAEESADPFQRRIDNALRHGFGQRESRILPRALNGLLSRA